MKLSVIIVNYNVKHFLEQCLCSLQKAMQGMTGEVIVVDNNSTDNSLGYLQAAFPSVRFIANSDNRGFAQACNQGLALSRGEYVLFLNPDTVLAEDSLQRSLAFLDQHARVGALGIKMIDGSGRYLRESKRSFPAPLTSLFKLFGLTRLFPHSKLFSKYYLGHLDENQNHEVDVLAGAFMMIRKEVLDKTGGFDETFFMYGEDVDLSYRIQQLGYQNYYFAESSIIHFKGESTKRGSLNYVRMFYNAMSIFVRKHYGGSRASLFRFFIHVAIWIRAILGAIGHFIRRIGLSLIDAGLILLSFWLMKNVWNEYVKTDTRYENRLLWVVFIAFTFTYLLVAYYAGLYDRGYKKSRLVRSTVAATIVLLAVYALLPEQFRFSRAIILFGAVLAFVLISLQRWLLVRIGVLSAGKPGTEHADTLIAGSADEYEKTLQLMAAAGLNEKVLGRVAVQEADKGVIGYWTRLGQLRQTVPFREVVFCEGQLSFKQIIGYLPQLNREVKIRLHGSGTRSIVGSDSRNTVGESVSKENGFRLSDPYVLRLKRLFDLCFSALCLLTFPVHLVGVRKPFRFFANCFSVLAARKTWVGYLVPENKLPPLRTSVISCNGLPVSQKQEWPEESLHMIDYWYARDYEPIADLKMVLKAYRQLGN